MDLDPAANEPPHAPVAAPPVLADSVGVWLVFTDDVRDASLLARCEALLSPEELARRSRFHFEADRHRDLLTRATVRLLLSRHVDFSAQDWRFEPSAHGRPELRDPPAQARSLSFNVSHTTGLIVVALARGARVGVDVENAHDRGRPVLEIAERYFSPAEFGALRTLPAMAQTQAFHRHWTLKEAYVKAIGRGLSMPLGSFHFAFDPSVEWVAEIAFTPPPGGDGAHWHFSQFRVGASFVGALCVEGRAGQSRAIEFRRFTPFGDDLPEPVQVTGRSCSHR